MEWKEAVKVESLNVGVGSSTTLFSDSNIDWYEEEKAPSVVFMDQLGFQQDHHFSSPLFDMLQQVQVPTPFSSSHSHLVQPPPPAMADSTPAAPTPVKVEPLPSDQLLNQQPTTPNSSSISSDSSGAPNDEGVVVKAVDNEEVQEQKTQKGLKLKKTNQKRQKEPRFAFMTKSEVDHLEDGYRWRKYGQKAVKNSPFPRSYYRCTTASCNVKKRVERSFNDPTTVVTTYEGQHTHPSPVMPRPTFAAGNGIASHHHDSSFTSTPFSTMPMLRNISSNSYQQQQQPYVNSLSSLGFGYNSGSPNPIPGNFFLNERRRFCSPTSGSALLKDHGLLHDIVVPPQMLKEEQQQ